MKIVDPQRRLAASCGPKLSSLGLEHSSAFGQDYGMHDYLLVLDDDASTRRLGG